MIAATAKAASCMHERRTIVVMYNDPGIHSRCISCHTIVRMPPNYKPEFVPDCICGCRVEDHYWRQRDDQPGECLLCGCPGFEDDGDDDD